MEDRNNDHDKGLISPVGKVQSLEVKAFKFGTNAIHAGVDPDPVTGAVITPVSLSTTFMQASPGVHNGYEYSRTDNPTRRALEKNIASLENGKWAVSFASGSACTASLINLLNAGDHIISSNDVYGGTYRYFSKVASKFGLEFSLLDLTDVNLFKNSIRTNTKLLWIEAPTNPLLILADISALTKIAHEHNILVVVDNTFMSPYNQRPLEFGVDLVAHSVTKFINGHSDVVMGIVVGNDAELEKRIRFNQNAIGAVPSPFDCFLTLRSTKTLHVRLERHNFNALKVAQFLEKHPKVERVIYPGLPSYSQYELAKRTLYGPGGIITIFIKGDLTQTRKFLESTKIFVIAESLGGVESLIDHPAIMTHASIPCEERLKIGITDNLVRLSVGLEDVDDLIADLENSLSKVK